MAGGVNWYDGEWNLGRPKNVTNPNEIDQIVQDILDDMPFKEKAAIANLDEVLQKTHRVRCVK